LAKLQTIVSGATIEMGVEEKTRASGDQPREQDGPLLPTVNPEADKPQPPKPSLHPALYVSVWIALSSSVILFNKWILSTLGFGKTPQNKRLETAKRDAETWQRTRSS
jgi:hypothetical protein